MMINFFEQSCQSTSKEVQFGLSDNSENDHPAFISMDNENWIAVINNPESRMVVFTAIDSCILVLRPDGQAESRCDGMLTHSENIDFIELKDKRKKVEKERN